MFTLFPMQCVLFPAKVPLVSLPPLPPPVCGIIYDILQILIKAEVPQNSRMPFNTLVNLSLFITWLASSSSSAVSQTRKIYAFLFLLASLLLKIFLYLKKFFFSFVLQKFFSFFVFFFLLCFIKFILFYIEEISSF